jgi:hypothetical protein
LPPSAMPIGLQQPTSTRQKSTSSSAASSHGALPGPRSTSSSLLLQSTAHTSLQKEQERFGNSTQIFTSSPHLA